MPLPRVGDASTHRLGYGHGADAHELFCCAYVPAALAHLQNESEYWKNTKERQRKNKNKNKAQ